jgi:hypothetical protein
VVPHPQFFLAWLPSEGGADLAATCVASEMPLPRYAGTSGPRDAAADPLQSSLGFSRTSTMQAISGGGDPATI